MLNPPRAERKEAGQCTPTTATKLTASSTPRWTKPARTPKPSAPAAGPKGSPLRGFIYHIFSGLSRTADRQKGN
nr:MAG TPA: hypothetical protein [Bacteriophage sp.]